MAKTRMQKSDLAKESTKKSREVFPAEQMPEALLETPEKLALQRAIAKPHKATPADILALQKTAGNHAVQRLRAQRHVLVLEEELQAKSDIQQVGLDGGPVPTDVENAINRARSDGKPLNAIVQKQMSERLGHDFSGVRVHVDSQADSFNKQLSARAFTTGRDIFFRQGEYNPGSGSGKELISHELTHVVQQSTGKVSGSGGGMTVRPAGDAFEQEADRVAWNAIRDKHEVADQANVGEIQRKVPEEEEDIQMKADIQPNKEVIQRMGSYPNNFKKANPEAIEEIEWGEGKEIVLKGISSCIGVVVLDKDRELVTGVHLGLMSGQKWVWEFDSKEIIDAVDAKFKKKDKIVYVGEIGFWKENAKPFLEALKGKVGNGREMQGSGDWLAAVKKGKSGIELVVDKMKSERPEA